MPANDPVGNLFVMVFAFLITLPWAEILLGIFAVGGTLLVFKAVFSGLDQYFLIKEKKPAR
jgi:hypothetical protein